MGGFELRWVVRVTVVLMMVPKILGWGKEGHYVICKIAEVTEVFFFLNFFAGHFFLSVMYFLSQFLKRFSVWIKGVFNFC